MTAAGARLLVLGQQADAEAMMGALRDAGVEVAWECVASEADYLAALEPRPEVILAVDPSPGVNALRALQRLGEEGLDVPFLVVTDALSEEATLAWLRQGAADVVPRGHLGRLAFAVRR